MKYDYAKHNKYSMYAYVNATNYKTNLRIYTSSYIDMKPVIVRMSRVTCQPIVKLLNMLHLRLQNVTLISSLNRSKSSEVKPATKKFRFTGSAISSRVPLLTLFPTPIA